MSFEVKKDHSINKTIRMPYSLIEKLEALAQREDISFNKLVVQCCEYALTNLKSSKISSEPVKNDED